jgi:hypothetical protein
MVSGVGRMALDGRAADGVDAGVVAGGGEQ